MELKDISVKKFIELFEIQKQEHETEIDLKVSLLACLTGKSEDYFYSLPMNEFNRQAQCLEVLNLKTIKASPAKFIKAGGNIYAPVYEFDKLTAGQLVDVASFCKEPGKIIENLPQILASFCLPTKRSVKGRKRLRYGSTSHKKVAEDMQAASVVDAYSIAVFFWVVWELFLQNTGGYIVREAIKNKVKMTKETKTALLSILQKHGDGITSVKG